MARTHNSRELKYYLERQLGAPIVEMVKSYNKYGYDLRAANGNQMFIDMQMAYELVGGDGAGPRDVYRFPMYSEPMAYAAYSDAFNSYSRIGIDPSPQYPAVYDGSVMMKPMPPPSPKRDPRKELLAKRTANYRKLFWHRYSKTGKYPFSTIITENVQK